MRILIVNQKALPSIGGKQRYTSRLANRLTEAGHQVEVVATVTREPVEREDRSYPTTYRPGLVRLSRSVAAADVVHLNIFSWRGIALGLLLRKPMLYVYHESGDRLCRRALGWRWWEADCGWHPRHPCIWCEQIRLLKSPRHWVLDPIKQRVMDRLLTIVGTCEWFLPRLPDDVRYIPYGLKMDELEPAESPTRDFVLFAARFMPEKAGSDIIRAIAECKRQGRRLRLVAIGDGPERALLETLARDLGVADQVEFTGEVTMAVLASYYRNALVVVVPSVWEEMFGTVSVEAMACRTPVIASAVGGMVETVGAAGLLFPPGDVEALAERILRVAGSPELAEEMAARGFELARSRYELGVMTRSYISLYEELLPKKRGPGKVAPVGAGSGNG